MPAARGGANPAPRTRPTRSWRWRLKDRASRWRCGCTVDSAALARGHTQPGERCEITGVGPVPVTTARALLDDASVAVMARDGDDITAVSSPKRTIPMKLRRALEARYPTLRGQVVRQRPVPRDRPRRPDRGTRRDRTSSTCGGSARITTISRPMENGGSSASPATGTSSRPNPAWERAESRCRPASPRTGRWGAFVQQRAHVGLERAQPVAEEVRRRVGHREVAGEHAVDVADHVWAALRPNDARLAEPGPRRAHPRTARTCRGGTPAPLAGGIPGTGG